MKGFMDSDIWIVAVLVLILLGGIIWIDYNNNQFYEEHGYTKLEAPCVEGCFTFNYTFFKYDTSGLGSNECYCLNNSNIVRIW